MGVTGLLPQLKPIQNPVSLHRYEGCTLAVDGYAWLHRAAHGCCEQLCLGEPTTRYLSFLIKKIDLLKRQHKITPFLVFDGDRLDAKAGTELKRRVKREENRKLGCELHKRGEKKKAWEYFQKSVDVTPEMAKCWIDYLQTHRLPYVVAPFEADAQMVYLEQQGFVDGIISEDSDLLIFGCTRLITKLKDNGECIEICRNDFEKLPRKFPLYELNMEQLRILVCLSGCDYTDGINRVGLNKAMDFVKKHNTMEKILLAIQRDGKYEVPKNFMDEYKRATICFQYQRVFCPKLQKLVTLNELPENPLDVNSKFFEYIGYGISVETGLKEYLCDLEMIDHNAHYLISIGEKTPGNHKRDLINREINVTQSFSNAISMSTSTSTTTIGAGPVGGNGDTFSQPTSNPAKRSITIDSFFLRSRDSLTCNASFESKQVANAAEVEREMDKNKPVASARKIGHKNLQHMLEKRNSLLETRSKLGISSLSIKQQLNNVIIDKRKLVPKTGISSSSKFFCTKAEKCKSTELKSEKIAMDNEEQKKTESLDIAGDQNSEAPKTASGLQIEEVMCPEPLAFEEKTDKKFDQHCQEEDFLDGSEDISFDVSRDLDEIEAENSNHLLSGMSSSKNASTDTVDDLKQNVEKTFVFNDDAEKDFVNKTGSQQLLNSRTSKRSANVMGFPVFGGNDNINEEYCEENAVNHENNSISIKNKPVKRSLVFSKFAYTNSLRNTKGDDNKGISDIDHDRIGDIKRVLRPKNPNVNISNNLVRKDVNFATIHVDTEEYNDTDQSKKLKVDKISIHSLQKRLTSSQTGLSSNATTSHHNALHCNNGHGLNKRQLFRSNTTSPIKSTVNKRIPSLSRFIYRE